MRVWICVCEYVCVCVCVLLSLYISVTILIPSFSHCTSQYREKHRDPCLNRGKLSSWTLRKMPTQEGGIYITGEDGRGREQEHKLGWGGSKAKAINKSTTQPLNETMAQKENHRFILTHNLPWLPKLCLHDNTAPNNDTTNDTSCVRHILKVMFECGCNVPK